MSNEKPLHQKSAQGKITRGQFHSVEHLVRTVTVQSSENSVFSVIFSPSVSVTQPQCPWHVPRRLFLLSEASHACVEPSWRRWRAGPPSPASSAASGPPVAADRRHTTAERRSAPPIAPWLSAWPHARQRTPVAQPPWPASTERALRRRRARALTVPSSSLLTPKPRPV